MTPTSDSKNGLSTFLSFGAKSVQPAILEKMLVGRQQTADILEQYARQIADEGANNQTLIIGPRGSGKTHLLRVLYHRITDLVQEKRVIVAYFAEEEYGISGYLDFLIRIINAFMRWYDADKPLLETQLNGLRETPESRQEYVAEKLISDYVGDKPLLILSENFDAILETLGRNGQGKLRAWLYRHNRISIMATAQASSPDLGREDRPFYGFFSTIKLKKLSYEDSLTLLTTLAETEKNETMLAHLAGKGRGQVRAIHELVKGNHRLLVTFYEFLKADTLADLSVVFMKTMNDLKPYYETFIRFLPAQQQKILHYLALAKIPRQGTDIAKDCFIATTSLSKQLSELQRQNLIDALPDPTDKRNKLYDVSEPLLRIAIEIGEQREGITSLFIDFMVLYYSFEEIQNQKERFEEMYLNEVEPLKKQKLQWEIEARERAMWIQMEINVKELRSLLEISKNLDLALDLVKQGRYIEVIDIIKRSINLNDQDESLWVLLASTYLMNDNLKHAVEAGLKTLQINPDNILIWNVLGQTYYKQRNYKEAVKAYEKVVSIFPEDDYAWNTLGDLYQRQEKQEQALNAYLKVIEINPEKQHLWFIISFLAQELALYGQALEAYEKIYDMNYSEDAAKAIIETSINHLQSQTATDQQLAKSETWLQNHPGFEFVATYVNIYRRVVFGKEEKALYELPKEQRIFFEREILKRNVE